MILFKNGEWELVKHEEGSLSYLKDTWISGSVYTNMSYGQVFQKVVEPRVSIDGFGCLYKVLGRGEDGLGFRYYTGPQKASATRGKMFSGVPLSRVEEIKNGSGSLRYKPILCYNDYSADFGNIRHEGGVPFNSGKKDIKGFGRKETKSKWGHSGFPLELPETCILLTTKENDIVLDPFMGSGTTGVACKELNRHFIGIELDENYFNMAKERIDNTK